MTREGKIRMRNKSKGGHREGNLTFTYFLFLRRKNSQATSPVREKLKKGEKKVNVKICSAVYCMSSEIENTKQDCEYCDGKYQI